jgi:hypothetical protein
VDSSRKKRQKQKFRKRKIKKFNERFKINLILPNVFTKTTFKVFGAKTQNSKTLEIWYKLNHY